MFDFCVNLLGPLALVKSCWLLVELYKVVLEGISYDLLSMWA